MGVCFQFAPLWWKSVSICFKYVGNGRQCAGKGTSKQHCASVGNPTSYYIDKGDLKTETCKISWALTAISTMDDWFRNVSLCQAYLNRDWKSGGKNTKWKFNCNPINKFTDFYTDLSSTQKYGYFLSWKITTGDMDANLVPFWFLNSKLCYSWSTGSGEEECKAASDPPVCALVNEWTPLLEDFTNDEDSYCKISWSIQSNAL